MRNLWQKWRNLKQNPVYLREQGHWGEPNPFFTRINRYWPFVAMAAIVFGACGGSSTIFNFFGTSNDELFALYCLICFPSALLTMLTLYGTFMAPALTAPMISLEQSGGSWDMLRLTPYSMRSILLAKLFGALSRLKVWWPILILSGIQLAGLLMTSSIAVGFDVDVAITIFVGALNGFLRPWAEVILAALIGMFTSMWVRSATTSLAITYGVVILFRIINSSLVWVTIFAFIIDDVEGIWVGQFVSTFIYYLVIAGLIYGILWKADKMFSS